MHQVLGRMRALVSNNINQLQVISEAYIGYRIKVCITNICDVLVLLNNTEVIKRRCYMDRVLNGQK